MKPLYEIAEDLKMLLDIDGDTESTNEELCDTIEALNMELEDKLKQSVFVIKELEAFALGVKAEKERLASRERSAKNRIEAIKNYLKESMETADKESVKFTEFSLRIQKNPPSANIVNPAVVPEEYMVITKTIDKKGVLNDLKNGFGVSGCELVSDKTHLRIR